jgi:hypothetical protein
MMKTKSPIALVQNQYRRLGEDENPGVKVGCHLSACDAFVGVTATNPTL